MFEEEIKLQKESSYLVPLVLVVGLIVVIVGSIGYWVFPTKKALDSNQAAALVTAFLKDQGPATVHFHTGLVQPSVDEKTRDPHYRLLEKAGVLRVGKLKGAALPVALTPEGERQLAGIPGVIKTKNPDGTDAYTVPLAERELASITSVTMNGRDVAFVRFTWKWAPNKLGDAFEASGPLVKSFNTWERSTLIEKYGAAFYRVEPVQASLTFVRSAKGWNIAAE